MTISKQNRYMQQDNFLYNLKPKQTELKADISKKREKFGRWQIQTEFIKFFVGSR